MSDRDDALARLYEHLGWRRLNPYWAKLEIALGLFAVAVGLFLGVHVAARPVFGWAELTAAVALFVLGGYLTLAGHRSHLYQSNNALVAYLTSEIERFQKKD